jgi:hypothetical protein
MTVTSAWTHPALLLAVSLACAGCPSSSTVQIAGPPVAGFNHAFPFPRSDIQPGDVVVVFKDGRVEPVCRKMQDYGGSGANKDSSPIDYKEDDAKELKAQLEGKARGFFESQFSGSHATGAKVKMRIVPVTDVDPTTSAIQASENAECKKKAAWRKSANTDIKFFSLVTSVVRLDLDYEVTTDTELALNVGLDEKAGEALGANAKVVLSDSDKKTAKVVGAQLVTRYNTDDKVLKL